MGTWGEGGTVAWTISVHLLPPARREHCVCVQAKKIEGEGRKKSKILFYKIIEQFMKNQNQRSTEQPIFTTPSRSSSLSLSL